tara:strand:+ start:834 stop:989 length:156 start_codon:yes stop_codon:yes gene_type:complete
LKVKSIKYNKKGLTRAENTAPKFVAPKKDLLNKKISIISDKHYIKIIEKST